MGRRLLIVTVCATAIAVGLRMFVIEGIYVATGSMEPTFSVDTQLFLEKVVLKFREPQYGDIVVFPSPIQEGRDLIKRIIGTPGDEIAIKEKKVFINGQEIVESYVQYTRPNERLKGDTLGRLTVPEGMVFVMGDNRDESRDSRDWIDPNTGKLIYFIPIKKIKGRVISLY